MIISFILTLFRKIPERGGTIPFDPALSRWARTRHLAAGMKNVLESGNPFSYVNLRWETDVYPYLSQLNLRRTTLHAIAATSISVHSSSPSTRKQTYSSLSKSNLYTANGTKEVCRTPFSNRPVDYSLSDHKCAWKHLLIKSDINVLGYGYLWRQHVILCFTRLTCYAEIDICHKCTRQKEIYISLSVFFSHNIFLSNIFYIFEIYWNT